MREEKERMSGSIDPLRVKRWPFAEPPKLSVPAEVGRGYRCSALLFTCSWDYTRVLQDGLSARF